MFANVTASWCRVGVKFIVKWLILETGGGCSRRLLQMGHFLRLLIKAYLKYVLGMNSVYLCKDKWYELFLSKIKRLGPSFVIHVVYTVYEIM